MKDKVMNIGTVRELTGLTERQIRYYEEKHLIFPFRTGGGMRRFSFEDVEKLKLIREKLKDGFRTFDLKKAAAQEWKAGAGRIEAP